MAEIENRRKNPDRRQQKIKNIPDERRTRIRREEDKKNLRAYYITLGISFGVLIALGIASFIYEGGF